MNAELKHFLKGAWKEAAIWALIAAFALEISINVISRKTLWHRVESVEEKVRSLEHVRELEELQTRAQLDELRRKSDSNTQVIEKVEEKVESKHR